MSEITSPARRFRPARVRFDAARAARQSRLTRQAIDAIGGVAAMRFLNAVDDDLGGCPLTIAGESEEALARMETVLAAHGVSRASAR